ncbi:MAG TPA: hypothetical protein VJV22_01925, partial [Acidobacteriaceae bacterium]|nr:hypothetical protein [Acidobacteriaceae bacterium]
YRALPGTQFCAGHSPDWDYRPCLYFNRRGRPCRGSALRGQDHCFSHSKRNRRATRPPIPLVPRTRRRKAGREPASFQAIATVPESVAREPSRINGLPLS